jgi:hypothetical protein
MSVKRILSEAYRKAQRGPPSPPEAGCGGRRARGSARRWAPRIQAAIAGARRGRAPRMTGGDAAVAAAVEKSRVELDVMGHGGLGLGWPGRRVVISSGRPIAEFVSTLHYGLLQLPA